MILEGIVTTLTADGAVNIAPMGPRLSSPYHLEPGSRFELRPYPTSRTWGNLRDRPEGVLHVTDDVLLLARAALGSVEPLPDLLPAITVRGAVLAGACRVHEFQVAATDTTAERVSILCQVTHTHRLRDFFGFNRAMHAVVEAAILATRTAFLPLVEIETDFRRLRVIVDKTGGPREQEAFGLLQHHLETVRASAPDAP